MHNRITTVVIQSVDIQATQCMVSAPEVETYFTGHDFVSRSLFPDIKTRLVKSNLTLIVQAFQADLLRSLCESFVEGFAVTFS